MQATDLTDAMNRIGEVIVERYAARQQHLWGEEDEQKHQSREDEKGSHVQLYSRLTAAFDALSVERYTSGAGQWKRVGGSSVFVGSDGKIKKGCPGLKGHAVADLVNESQPSRDARESKQAHAEARGLTGNDLTASEASFTARTRSG